MSTKLHPSVHTHLTLAREQIPAGAPVDHVDHAVALDDLVRAAETLLRQVAAHQAKEAPDQGAAVGPYLNRAASAILDAARECGDAIRLVDLSKPRTK